MSFLKRLGERAPAGGFVRGVLALATGTSIAQALLIAVSPILTRLYSPEDMGVFALFAALSGFLALVGTGRYELAVMLPQDDADADALVIVSLAVSASFSLLLLLPIVAWRDAIASVLGNDAVSPWLLLLPLSVFVTGAYNALNYWLNRHKRFGRMSVNRVLQSGVGAGGQVVMGAASMGAAGLILGQLLGWGLTCALIAFSFARNVRIRSLPRIRRLSRALAVRYANHPTHLLPAHGIGAAAQQVPILAISALFGAAAAGFYALAERIVYLPSALIANAIGDVYRQRASVQYREQGSFKRLFLMTLFGSAALAIIPVALVFALAPDLFALVFGESWRVAGDYARILLIASFFQFVFTPVDKGALIVGATRYIMVWHVIRLAAFSAAAVLSWKLSLTIEKTLLLFVLANVFVYVLDGIVEYKLSLERKD